MLRDSRSQSYGGAGAVRATSSSRNGVLLKYRAVKFYFFVINHSA